MEHACLMLKYSSVLKKKKNQSRYFKILLSVMLLFVKIIFHIVINKQINYKNNLNIYHLI